MIRLTVPPQPTSMAVMRATVGAIAARASMTLDQIEDVRMAVEEAALLLLPGGESIQMTADPDAIEGFIIEISAPSSDRIKVETKSLAWMVLQGMTDQLILNHSDRRTSLVMRFYRVTASR